MTYPARQPCDEALIRSTEVTSPCARRAQRWVLTATIIASSMAFIDGTVVNIALPVLQVDFDASVAGVQWVVESYALLLAALILPGGSFGDRFGRKRVFAFGTALFALASAWCGLAPSITQLILARAVQGIGAALMIPMSLAIIGASFPPERRGRAIGTWSAFTAMSMAFGPVLGGLLVEYASWRVVFYINLPLAAVVGFALLRGVPESRADEPSGPIDWPGTLLATLGLGGIIYGLIESSRLGLGNPVVVAGLLAGVAALAAFLLVEKRSRSPLMPLPLFRSTPFSGANGLTLLLYGALSAVFFFLPFNLLQVQDYSASKTGLSLLPFSVVVFLLSRWSGGLVDRFGARPPLVVGPLTAGAGMVLLALPGIDGSYWSTFFPGIFVVGLGMAVTAAPLTTSVLNSVGEAHTGVASGINNAISRVGALLTIALFGIVILQFFTGALRENLAALQVSEETVRRVMLERTQLAALEIDVDSGPVDRDALRQAVASAFVAGFRWVMLICAGLAVTSAAIAWIAFRGERRSAVPVGRRRGHDPQKIRLAID
ncbi:MAG: DHA2 family efflux MFS transporter permease subunit [Candidatus Eisenbacteria bacterium]|nr:DHA2 family efflux MFS transporter permease subunit [Candidatus Latescibacterota bacterium]MBD3301136.1 DHA2 family efflux MFS transporter permease subunit [Candidatus Eisenbacteria bacterium]